MGFLVLGMCIYLSQISLRSQIFAIVEISRLADVNGDADPVLPNAEVCAESLDHPEY